VTSTARGPAWIELTGAHNVRDLGGLPAAGGRVRPGVLLRGDNLDALTPEDVALLRDEVGLRGVVDLRAAFENPRAADWLQAADIAWIHEPLVDFTGLSQKAPLGDLAGDHRRLYALMLEHAAGGLVRILDFLVAADHAPTLVHCAAGKDRTGITTAVLLRLAGVERDAITADYLATGERLERIRSSLMRRAEYRHLRDRGAAGSAGDKPLADDAALADDGPLARALMLNPEAILAVLDTVDAAPGGAVGFMAAAGARPETIDRWQSMIIQLD